MPFFLPMQCRVGMFGEPLGRFANGQGARREQHFENSKRFDIPCTHWNWKLEALKFQSINPSILSDVVCDGSSGTNLSSVAKPKEAPEPESGMDIIEI